MDYLISDTTLDNIATAIREKTGKQDKMTPVQMPDEIRGISGGGEPEPPDDGKTRLYITVPANSMEGLPPPRNQVPLYIQQTVDRGVTIDWGDGSATETLQGIGAVNTTHTYEQAGDYVISLDPADGCELGFGCNESSFCVMGNAEPNGFVYTSMLKNCSVGKAGMTIIDSYAFNNCIALSSVTIPDGVTSIELKSFESCLTLSSVTIPDSVTSISDYAFDNCFSLSSVTIPDSVTSIGFSAFGGCYSVREYHLLPMTPPHIPDKNTFYDITPDCIIYVPVGSLEAYQSATNWSEYADQMQEEPA